MSEARLICRILHKLLCFRNTEQILGAALFGWAPGNTYSVRNHALVQPQIHPSDFHSVHEIYPLKSTV